MVINDSSQVLIVGGGIVGLCSALSMSQRGYSVTVLEAKPQCTQNADRVYALNHASIQWLTDHGIWPHLPPSARTPYCRMRIEDAVNEAHLELNAQLIARSELGFIVADHALNTVLLEQCLIAGVTVHFEAAPERIQPTQQAICVFSGEHSWRADLLMITDGANSPSLQQLAIPLTTWPYKHHAIVTTVHTEKPHQYTAYQRFHPEGPLAFLPKALPNECSIVWSTSPERAAELMHASESEFKHALAVATSNAFGKIITITERQAFPLYMRHTTQYAGTRWIVLGDAAHTIHPLAGLGLNLSLADLSCWLRLQKTYPMPYQASRAHQAYQRERKCAVWQLIALMEALKIGFSVQNAPIQTLRGLGLTGVNHLPQLKRWFIEYANLA